jgi:hypothetical protein
MAEDPLDGAKEPTRAENIVSSLVDKFAATATLEVCTVNQCVPAIARLFLSPRSGTGWEPVLVDETGEPLEGVAEVVELARGLSVTSRLLMRGLAMSRSRRPGR